MANQYSSEKYTIGELLSLTSPNTVIVPEWQRSFSWSATHIETFWTDLTAFSNRYPDDTIEAQEYFLGSVVLVVSGNEYTLLDGQQRLATATILLSVLRDKVASFKADAATRTMQKWICEFDDAKNSNKFKLTMNHYDRDFFRQEIQTYPRTTTPEMVHQSHKLIRGTREFFERKFNEEYEKLGGGEAAYLWALRIRQVLTDHISVVAVSSQDEDNAASVFETLNDRGIGLSTPDLLRNLLLRRANPPDRDEIIRCWDTVLSLEKKVEQFLRHFWLSRHGDVKTQSLYREIKASILSLNTNSLDLSRELKQEAEIYVDLTSAADDNADIQRLLSDVRLLNANALYPPMLSAAIKYSDEHRYELLKGLINYFVRHTVIGNLENSQLESVVYSLAMNIRGGTSLADALQEVKSKSTSDDDFKRRFATVSISRQNTARYLLRKLVEHRMATEELTVELPDKVHVEHIYPQEPRDADRLSGHGQLVYRLGNLTLLAKKLNTAARNNSFVDKKRYYEQSQILITRDLLDQEKWTEAEIDARQGAFSEAAVQIWL